MKDRLRRTVSEDLDCDQVVAYLRFGWSGVVRRHVLDRRGDPPGLPTALSPGQRIGIGVEGLGADSNFVITGILMIAAAAGTRQALDVTFGPALLALFGVGLVGSGVCTMDPMWGYPPGTEPRTPAVLSRRHKAHDVFGFVMFSSLGAAVTAFAFALEGGWKTYSLATAAVFLVLFVSFGAAWERHSPRTGLLQRLAILVGWTWIALLCLSLVSP